MKLKSICAVLCFLSSASLAFADTGEISVEPNAAQEGFFAGLSGGSNSMQVSQQVNTNGTIHVDTTNPVAGGDVSGSADSFDASTTSFVPGIQLGYFKHFSNSDYLWGTKLSYQYIGQTSTNTNSSDIAPDLLETLDGGGTYAGQISAASIQTTLNHQFAFMPFIGRSFANSYVYFGAGPALFGTETKANSVTGTSNVNAVPNDSIGDTTTLSNSKWVWGGVAQIGVAYYLDSDWFIDANYTYAITQNYSENYSTPFTNIYVNGETTYTNTGTANVSTSQQITNQTFAISINKMF